ncbi:hypothetical protein HQ531_00115 [bacterium]|nr:hypothetical protein [bacterium]
MRNLFNGTLLVLTMLLMLGCDNATSPLAPQVTPLAGEFSENSLARRGDHGGGSNNACSAFGEFAGYTESNAQNYTIYEYTLWAGKHNDAGTVVITNDDEYIYVTYNTNETADLGEVHVYVWTSLDDIPTRRPAPGHADYVVEGINADSYTVVIPADLACGDTYYVSTHAALVGNDTDDDEAGSGDNAGETAYAGDASSPDCFDATSGAWWGYVVYSVECFYNISGRVYEDANANSDDDGEAGLEGVLVNLLDGEDNILTTTTTDANGDYLFENVAAGGDYQILVGDLAGMNATENANGFVVSGLTSDASDIDFGYNTPDDGDDSCESTTYPLYAGQVNAAGTVSIINDGIFLYVTYTTNLTADLGSLHVNLSADVPDSPVAPGQSTYKSENDRVFIPGSDFYTARIHMETAGFGCDDNFIVLAHAALVADAVGDPEDSNAGETAYAGDVGVNLGGDDSSWFYYMATSVCCSNLPPQ